MAVSVGASGAPELFLAQSGGYVASLTSGGAIKMDSRVEPTAGSVTDIGGSTELIVLSGSPSSAQQHQHQHQIATKSNFYAVVSLDGTYFDTHFDAIFIFKSHFLPTFSV